MATFLAIDGNLARITGWYRFEPGMPLFSQENTRQLSEVCWMRIRDLHDEIVCAKDETGTWWIIKPFKDRLAPSAVQAIFAFTAKIASSISVILITALSIGQNPSPERLRIAPTSSPYSAEIPFFVSTSSAGLLKTDA